jgi:RNA polymerase sigma factor for flagellar operon FliA
MAEIAADLGVTESRVSQLRSEALRLLRGAMQANDGAAPVPAPRPRRRSDVAAQMCAAVATRSTLAERLDATTLLGESRPELWRSGVHAGATAELAVAEPVA